MSLTTTRPVRRRSAQRQASSTLSVNSDEESPRSQALMKSQASSSLENERMGEMGPNA